MPCSSGSFFCENFGQFMAFTCLFIQKVLYYKSETKKRRPEKWIIITNSL